MADKITITFNDPEKPTRTFTVGTRMFTGDVQLEWSDLVERQTDEATALIAEATAQDPEPFDTTGLTKEEAEFQMRQRSQRTFHALASDPDALAEHRERRREYAKRAARMNLLHLFEIARFAIDPDDKEMKREQMQQWVNSDPEQDGFWFRQDVARLREQVQSFRRMVEGAA